MGPVFPIVSSVNSTNHLRRNNINSTQTFLEYWRGGTGYQPSLWGQHYPDVQILKLSQRPISVKKPKQYFIKPNSTIQKQTNPPLLQRQILFQESKVGLLFKYQVI